MLSLDLLVNPISIRTHNSNILTMVNVLRFAMNYNEHNASARGVKMITISRAQRGNSITEPTAQQEVLLVI